MRIHSRLALAFVLLLFSVGAWAESPSPLVGPYAVAKTFHVGGPGGWDYLTLSADGGTLYVPRSGVTQIIDAKTGKVTGEISGFTTPHGVGLVPALHRAFVSDGDRKGNPGVTIFDTDTNKVLAKIKTPPDSDGIIFDAYSNHVFVVSGDGHVVIPIAADVDPANAKAEAAIELGGAPEFLASDGRGKIFINLSDTDQVAVVDAKSQKVLAKYSTKPGGEPTGMAIDVATHRIFLGCRKPAKLVVMSTEDGKVVADFDIGAVVDATAFDAPYVFASCADGTLTIVKQIDAEHYVLADTLKTALGARTMTVDTAAHVAYLVTSDFEPAAPVAKTGKAARPKSIADSFKILVLTRNPQP